jgi:hypothetical protein
MDRATLLDSIVRRTIPTVIDKCRKQGIEKVFSHPKRGGGVVSVVRQAWRIEMESAR